VGPSQDDGKCIDVTAWINKLGANGSDEITASAYAIADSNHTTAEHGLIHHNSKRIVGGRKNHEIGRGVHRGELRLIDETKKSDTRSNAESSCFRLELRAERALTGKNKNGIRKIRFRKSPEKIRGTLPRLELCAE
jgi:hypothetical protein